LNIWASYFSGWDKENYEFPFTSRKNKLFKCRDELLLYTEKNWGDDQSSGLYTSFILEFPCNLIFDETIQSWVNKYVFCKEFKTQAFKGCYDEYPAYWIDFCQIMKSELNKCEKESIRRGK